MKTFSVSFAPLYGFKAGLVLFTLGRLLLFPLFCLLIFSVITLMSLFTVESLLRFDDNGHNTLVLLSVWLGIFFLALWTSYHNPI